MKSTILRFIKRFFKKKAVPVAKKEQDLSEMYYEMQTVREEMKHLSDIELYDICIMDIQIQQREDLDQLYDKLAAGEKLTPEERKEVEAFYLLTTMELAANE